MIPAEELIISHRKSMRDTIDYPSGMSNNFHNLFSTLALKKAFFSTNFKLDYTKRLRLLYVQADRNISDINYASAKAVMETLKNKQIDCLTLDLNDIGSYTLYIHAIKESVFVICLSDNVDSSRLYEIWVMGAIPILEFNQNIAKKYLGLPVLWTTNYSEITGSYLVAKRDEFMANAKFRISAYSLLTRSHYEREEKKLLAISSSSDEEVCEVEDVDADNL